MDWKNKTRPVLVTSSALVGCLLSASTFAASVTLFNETFNGVNSGYYNAPTSNNGTSGSHSITGGVPTSVGGGSSISGGADEVWYGARFEHPDSPDLIGNGTYANPGDIGVQQYGGAGHDAGFEGNATPGNHVGLLSDDGGIMFKLDTTGKQNIQLSFDWRTFLAGSRDRLVVGYFLGDLTAGRPASIGSGFDANNTIDLQNEAQFTNGASSSGPHDGAWNWSPILNQDGSVSGFQGGQWQELMRKRDNTQFTNESFSLAVADNQSEVWVAFWLDNGDGDFGKIDDIVVTADTVVPVPAAVWLFGSGLLGLVGIARRKKS